MSKRNNERIKALKLELAALEDFDREYPNATNFRREVVEEELEKRLSLKCQEDTPTCRTI